VDKIFKSMDKDSDQKLTHEEFGKGIKQDPAIAKVHSPLPQHVLIPEL